jgi:hypothetical protein
MQVLQEQVLQLTKDLERKETGENGGTKASSSNWESYEFECQGIRTLFSSSANL